MNCVQKGNTFNSGLYFLYSSNTLRVEQISIHLSNIQQEQDLRNHLPFASVGVFTSPTFDFQHGRIIFCSLEGWKEM